MSWGQNLNKMFVLRSNILQSETCIVLFPVLSRDGLDSDRLHFSKPWGPFLERPSKLTGPVSYFEIRVSRKVGCVLTSNEVHFLSLAENFTV